MSARIALVMTSNALYKNAFIERLVKACPANIALIAELKFKHPRHSTTKHLGNYVRLLGPKGLAASTVTILRAKTNKVFADFSANGHGYSLPQIARKNRVPYAPVASVNSSGFLELLNHHRIDYIINSGNQIYRGPILAEYAGKILNRHTSMLPAYGGIYPIFWQLLHDAPDGGVTLHWIDGTIDGGKIAYQQPMRVRPERSLFEHYREAFDISFDLCSQAIADLSCGVVKSSEMTGEPSYFSWPKSEDVHEFRKRGLRIA